MDESPNESMRVKILRQNIVNFESKLPGATDKDSLRRQIKACQDRIRAEGGRP
jgi:hypothetical protein